MDYEEFYGEYAELAGQLGGQIAECQKLLRRVSKNVERGDLRAAARDIPAINEAAASCSRGAGAIAGKIGSADMRGYLESGDFARQLVGLCGERRIDIKGEGNAYEVFPYRLKIDAQGEELLINRRKAAGLRPSVIAGYLEKERDRLLAAPFNSAKYAEELAAAYDLALLSSAKDKKYPPAADVYLKTIYRFLTPMSRFRRDYDMQAYAFDLSRLYEADLAGGIGELEDGRRLQFGPSRDNNKSIRIVDSVGNERFLVTIRFFRA
jgi:hypothetical protein